MRIRLTLLYSIFFFFISSSCIDIISFDTEYRPGLVIEGKITNSTTHTPYVRIATTSEDDGEKTAITDARVDLYVDDEQTVPFLHVENGLYEPLFKIIGKPGSSYQIEIRYADRRYQSTPEVLPTQVGSDSISYEVGQLTRLSPEGVEIKIPGISVFVESKVPASETYLRWDLEEVYTYKEMVLPAFRFPFYSPGICFVTEPVFLQELQLFTTRGNTTTEIPRRLIYEKAIDETFEEVHYFAIIQNAITRAAFEYWVQIDQTANRDGSLFETPPATVRGNIYDVDDPDQLILGYFEATKTDTSSFYVTNDGLNFYVAPVCDVLPSNLFFDIPFMCFDCVIEDLNVRRSCIDCTTLPNSSQERPPYFPDLSFD